MIPGRLSVAPPLTVMLLLVSDVRPEKLGDAALIEIVPPLYDVSWAVEIVAGPSMVR
jgi:hypothetical protein